MLFKINPTTKMLESVHSDWAPREMELERYLVTQADADIPVMSESVFGEPVTSGQQPSAHQHKETGRYTRN